MDKLIKNVGMLLSLNASDTSLNFPPSSSSNCAQILLPSSYKVSKIVCSVNSYCSNVTSAINRSNFCFSLIDANSNEIKFFNNGVVNVTEFSSGDNQSYFLVEDRTQNIYEFDGLTIKGIIIKSYNYITAGVPTDIISVFNFQLIK